jgi:hypothetical protein
MHSGALDFNTELGAGTTFRLLLPIAQAQSQENKEVLTTT